MFIISPYISLPLIENSIICLKSYIFFIFNSIWFEFCSIRATNNYSKLQDFFHSLILNVGEFVSKSIIRILYSEK